MSIETERKIRLWILGGVSGVLLSIVGFGTMRLIDSFNSGMTKLDEKVTTTNEALIGFMAAQTEKNDTNKEAHDKFEKSIDKIRERFDGYRIAGKSIIEANPRGQQRPLDTLLEANKR